ncbi:MAG: DNA-protecting protein DprA [Firmicutes bacterium HGW-Firmicutes-15]|nr:MAG: DNA-protecting protein DprA [Firmicutes bacterium HGW-Firmicutes-15]
MDITELAILYFFHTLKGIGNKTLWIIKDEWGSFQNCFEADSRSLYRSSLSVPIIDAIVDGRRRTNPSGLLEKLRDEDIKICCVGDDDYPQLLGSIFDPPYIFYYHGNIEILKDFCIAIVGSRAASTYGKGQARRFGNELANHGMVVVSGMARGIDTEAHRGALEARGRTVAVLGSGVDVVYPPESVKLYTSICESGLVLSEFPPHAHPEPGNFPVRNRTISGLCRGVLVVEAQKKSGALITADFALEQGREVFAVPGPINSKNSVGTNFLIKQGACLVSGIEDILAEYGLNNQNDLRQVSQGELLFGLEVEELSVVEALGHEAEHFDILMGSTGLSTGALSAVLLKLELKGIIKALPGNYYVKI